MVWHSSSPLRSQVIWRLSPRRWLKITKPFNLPRRKANVTRMWLSSQFVETHHVRKGAEAMLWESGSASAVLINPRPLAGDIRIRPCIRLAAASSSSSTRSMGASPGTSTETPHTPPQQRRPEHLIPYLCCRYSRPRQTTSRASSRANCAWWENLGNWRRSD